jgi:hypothetical protein
MAMDEKRGLALSPAGTGPPCRRTRTVALLLLATLALYALYLCPRPSWPVAKDRWRTPETTELPRPLSENAPVLLEAHIMSKCPDAKVGPFETTRAECLPN